MSNRVLPEPPPPPSPEHLRFSQQNPPPPPPPPEQPRSPQEKPPPPPPLKTPFVIQLPKDQIYRIPPPENAYHQNFYTRRSPKPRRRTSAALFLLAISLAAVAAAAGVLYLIVLPKPPSLSIESLSIHSLNLSSLASGNDISPEIALAVRSVNPNKIAGILYPAGGSVAVAAAGGVVCRGKWPSFFQGKRNATTIQTLAKGSGIRLSDSAIRQLTAAVDSRKVPLEIRVEVPVRLKFGAVTSWTATVKLRCYVTVDKLTADSQVANKSCKVEFQLF